MASAEEEINPYVVLGIEDGLTASEDDIKKAYRKLSLKLHPDRNPSPDAAAAFVKLHAAYEILQKIETRKVVDDAIRAQAAAKERDGQRSQKRQKMMEELEKKERQELRKQSELERAKARLQEEWNKVRQQFAEKAAEEAQRAQRVNQSKMAENTGSSGAAAAAPVLTQEMRSQLARSLKIKWNRKDGNYESTELREIFSVYGVVEDVVILENNKRNKGRAIVVMSTLTAAAAAASAVNGHLSNPLLVVPMSKVQCVADGAAQLGVDAGQVAPTWTAAPPLFPVPAHTTRNGGAQQTAVPSTSQTAPVFTFPAAAHAAAPPLFPVPSGPSLFPAAAKVASMATGGNHSAAAAGGPTFPSVYAASAPPSPSSASSYKPMFPAASFSSFPGASFPSKVAPAMNPANRDFESLTLRKMRQAAERAKEIEVLKAREAQEE